MILVENIIYKDEKKYLQIRIHTACCKSVLLAEDQGPEKLWNPMTGDYLLWGMVKSVRQAERYYNEMLKMQQQTK